MNGSRRSGATILGALLLAVACILTSVAEAATVTRGPYLQMGMQDRMVLRWRTDVATDSRVSYGLCFGEENCLTWEKVDATLTTEHEVLLEGLAPNTRYYYAIGTTTDILAGNDSSHSFVTSVPAGISKRTRVWVLGDSGTGNADARAVRDAYATYAGSQHTDLWLMLGDNAYNRGTDTEYQTAVFNTYPEMLRKSVLWPSFGNHDGSSAEASTQTGPYFDIFTLPRNAEVGGVPTGTEAYYSFDYANIHFVVLDSFGSDRSPGGEMLTWLRADLEATRQDWIIAYWHHPPYSKGSHNSNTETALKQMRQNALPVLEGFGVDLVLAGHSHAYERSFLIDGHYGTSTTLVASMILDAGSGNPDGSGPYVKPARGTDPHKGTIYVVAGSSGKLSSEGALNHPAMFVSLEAMGSLVLTVDGNRLDAAFLRSTGTVGDAFTILKGSPSNIEVTPNVHAYDSVAVESEAVQTFQIRNRSTVDLEVAPSLVGDEVAEFSIVEGEAPFTIAAGETRTLDVRFAPTSFGPKSALLRLSTSEPDQNPVDVALSGIGVTAPDIDATLTALDYGDVLVGAASAQTFTIMNVGTADLQVSATSLVDGDASEFAVLQGAAPFIVAPGATQNIDVHFAPTSGGPKTTTLRLTSDDPDESPLDLSLSGTAITAPEIDVAPTMHNYGALWVGRDGVQAFAVRNVGSADLQVMAAGLVGGEAGEFGIVEGAAPFTIAPGATHNLVVRFAPDSPGVKNTTLRLSCDDQDESVVDLAVGGTGIMPPDIDVTAAPDYGNVVVGTTAFGTFIVRNLGGADLQVSASHLVQGQAEEFAITQGGAPFVVASGQAHSLEVRFAPTSRGPKGTTLRLASDDPDESAVDVAASGTGLLPADIDLTPPPDYGEVIVGTTATRALVIRNLGDVELQVAASLVSGATNEFAIAQENALFTVLPGATHNLDIQFIPASGGPKTATLRVASDDHDETTVDVTLVGTGMMPPDIDLGPAPPDYGQVLVGTMVSRTYVIRNLGDVGLQVAADLGGSDAGEFALIQGSAPFMVPPGSTHNVDVTFAPTSGGPKSTTLRLTSNDTDEATIDVAMSGIGLMPADIDLPTTSHPYGNVVVGTTASGTLVIGNLGDVNLQVTGVSLIGGEAGEFAIAQGAAPFTIVPGGTHAVEVHFAPASRGLKTTTLRLTSDDADETTVDVAMSGLGLMPADIDLAATAHDYGQVVVGTTATRTVVIQNLGDVDLHVTATSLVDGQAGEFAISQGSGPFTVAPGATHVVDVRFVPSSGGAKAATLRLTSDDADETTVDVAMSGLGLMPPDIDLAATAHDYGQVVVGTSASRTIVVGNLGDVELQVTATTVVDGEAHEFGIIQGGAPFTVGPGTTHTLDVRFAPAARGPKTTTLRLISNDADETTVDVALSGIGLMPADIDLLGTAHDYGQVVVGTTALRTIVVRNIGDVDLHVTATNLDDDEAGEFTIMQGSAPFTVAAGGTQSVDVRFAPASGGSKTTSLRLISDDEDESTVDVALSGIGLMPADIDLTTAAQDYGQVVVGTTAMRTIVVRNLGDVALHIATTNLVNGEAGEFAVTQGGAPLTVAPGGTHTVDVRFAPASGGGKTTTLRLVSDDADEASVDVTLSGIGLMPPDIDLAATAHDYGQVVVGTTALRTIVVRNIGDVALQVAAANLVDGEAGVFTITQGSTPFTVAPGGTHTVEVQFAPASGGLKTAVLRLTSDDADEAIVDVTLSGTGLMPADIHLAATSHDYGQVVIGTAAAQTFVIRNLGDVDLQVTAINVVEGGTAGFAVSQGGAPFTLTPGAAHDVEVHFAPTSAGDKTARLRLISNDQDESVVDVVMTGRGMRPPDIDLAPVAHDYGQAIVGTTASRVFAIANLGDVDLHVTAPSLIGGESTEFLLTETAGFTVAPGATHSLEIRFVPTSGGPKVTTLRLTSDDPDESAVDLAISGIGMMPPDIDVEPVLFDYGDVLVGTTALRTFVIRNLGDVVLQVTGAILVGSDAAAFAVTQGDAPFTVAPGATHNLDVRFAPTAGGLKTVTLRLTSDDSDESAVDVALSGTATTAPEIDVVLTPLHYGETLVGTTSLRTFAVQNVGSADLHATASLISGDAGEFAVTQGASFTVAPGVTHPIDLTFAPSSGGPKATTLRLTSDDVDEASVDVAVGGIGMMPADIDLGPTTHNYGDVLLGTTASATFAIRNLGDVSLQVSLATIVDDETGDFAIVQGGAPFTVAPGATHNLDVRFTPTSAGPKAARLRFTSDDQDENVVDVTLNGTATTAPEIDVVTTTQNYGVVWVGADASRTFVIRNVGSAVLHVTATGLVGGEAAEFAIVQGAAPFTLAAGATHQLEVRFTPASAGTKAAAVRLMSDDQDEGTVDLTVGGTGIMPPDIDATPPQHEYGEVVVGMTRSRTFSISNLGGADLQVTAANLNGADAGEFAIAQGGAPFTVVPGAAHTLEVRLAPTSEGLKTATLRLTSDDPDEGAIDVQMNGTGTILVPDIDALPQSHDFGPQAVGTAMTQSFVVNNTGTKNLVVGAPTLSGPDAAAFTVVNGLVGFTIAPGATRLIEIRFNPVTAGPKTATLTIPSDDPDENPVLIPLEGTTPPTFMEATEGGASNAGAVTTATSLTGVAGHLYLAAVSTKPYREVNTMTGLGLNWMRVTTQCAGRSQTGIELWWAQGSASTGQVTATLVSAPNNAVIAVARYGGVAPASPVTPLVSGNTNGVNGSCDNATDTATYLFNVTPTQSNTLVFGAVALRNKTHTSVSGYTTRTEASHGTAGNVAGIALVDRAAPLATPMPLNGTLNSAVDWAVIGIELRSGPQ